MLRCCALWGWWVGRTAGLDGDGLSDLRWRLWPEPVARMGQRQPSTVFKMLSWSHEPPGKSNSSCRCVRWVWLQDSPGQAATGFLPRHLFQVLAAAALLPLSYTLSLVFSSQLHHCAGKSRDAGRREGQQHQLGAGRARAGLRATWAVAVLLQLGVAMSWAGIAAVTAGGGPVWPLLRCGVFGCLLGGPHDDSNAGLTCHTIGSRPNCTAAQDCGWDAIAKRCSARLWAPKQGDEAGYAASAGLCIAAAAVLHAVGSSWLLVQAVIGGQSDQLVHHDGIGLHSGLLLTAAAKPARAVATGRNGAARQLRRAAGLLLMLAVLVLASGLLPDQWVFFTPDGLARTARQNMHTSEVADAPSLWRTRYIELRSIASGSAVFLKLYPDVMCAPAPAKACCTHRTRRAHRRLGRTRAEPGPWRSAAVCSTVGWRPSQWVGWPPPQSQQSSHWSTTDRAGSVPGCCRAPPLSVGWQCWCSSSAWWRHSCTTGLRYMPSKVVTRLASCTTLLQPVDTAAATAARASGRRRRRAAAGFARRWPHRTTLAGRGRPAL